MSDGRDEFTARLVGAIGDIDPGDWDRCAGGDNPFVSHAFLHALEESGSVGDRSGWWPQHMVLSDSGNSGKIVGCLPLYLKNNSYGEYVFDHAWAHALEQAGGRYYPKLQCAVPFTPVPGPRLLTESRDPAVKRALVRGAVEFARRMGVSSLHVTFASEADAAVMAEAGLLQRLGQQFHWHNRGYGSFDDFLATLSSRKRKAIRKERREAVESGLEIVTLSGSELTDEHWDAFFTFYMDTGSRKWGRPYLNRDFFRRLHASMADRVVLVLARRAGRWIAGAWNMRGKDTLYGRNWGCIEYHPFLHFECCYYQAIEYAIRHRLKRVEAGAQGEHKLARGYLPVPIHSVHWMADRRFHDAIGRYLQQERAHMAGLIEALDQHSPFRQTGPVPESE